MSSTLELPKEYPVFEANQVLTNAHLNDLVEYLEGHDRASRANLSGIGIVCGLEPSLETRSGNLGLRVTKGVGVTSAGYLLRITEGHYTRRKVFPAAEANKYSAFQGAGTIHELLPQGTSNTQSVDRAFLESRCFVLYLEKEDKPLKDCIGPDCERQGQGTSVSDQSSSAHRCGYGTNRAGRQSGAWLRALHAVLGSGNPNSS